LPLLVLLAFVVAQPSGAVSPKARLVTVPSVVGLKWQKAERRLAALALRAAFSVVHSQQPAGTVVVESPRPGSHVRRGTIVRLGVANPAAVTVPDVIGRQKAAAQERLREGGLTPHVVYVKSLAPVQSVVAQSPKVGVKVVLGTRVSISVSIGPGP
jgi:serine/threonine-protein kinase